MTLKATRPTLSQVWSFKIRRTTLKNYTNIADPDLEALKLLKGRSGNPFQLNEFVSGLVGQIFRPRKSGSVLNTKYQEKAKQTSLLLLLRPQINILIVTQVLRSFFGFHLLLN